MRALIRKQFPDHGILGEEYGSERTDAEYVWVLDPIDGTKSFIAGMLAWGTLIGLMRFGEPVFGMMNQPFTRERFSGDGGARALSRAGRRPRSACARLREHRRRADVHDKPAADEPQTTARLSRRLEDKVKLSRYGGDCYAYCMLAAGLIDLIIETEIKPYDIVAIIPIVAGAGGIVTTWENGPAQGGGRVIVAGDKRVHQAALEILNG